MVMSWNWDVFRKLRGERKERSFKRESGIVWESIYLIKGVPDEAVAHAREVLDELLTDFAADWYRDNPLK